MPPKILNSSLWNLSCAALAASTVGCIERPPDDEPEADGYLGAAYLEVDDMACEKFEVTEITAPSEDAAGLTFMQGRTMARDLDGDGANDVLVQEGTRFFVRRGGEDCRTELEDLRFATEIAVGDPDRNGDVEIGFNDAGIRAAVVIRPEE